MPSSSVRAGEDRGWSCFFFFKQKTAYDIGLGIPAEPLFRSKLRKCSSKIITSILSFISGRLATKSKQIKQLSRNGRSASLQRTVKKSFTSFSHSTRNKTRDGLIRVRNIRALNGRVNTSRSEERFSRNAESDLVCRLLLEKKK